MKFTINLIIAGLVQTTNNRKIISLGSNRSSGIIKHKKLSALKEKNIFPVGQKFFPLREFIGAVIACKVFSIECS